MTSERAILTTLLRAMMGAGLLAMLAVGWQMARGPRDAPAVPSVRVARLAPGSFVLVNAPLLLTGTMAWFTSANAPVHFPGAAFIVAAVFGLLAIVMLRRLPRVTGTDVSADQIPPSVTA